jgi:heme a synthase
MDPTPLIDLSPIGQLLLVGAALALPPLLWVVWRHRHGSPAARLQALTLLTLFLTFDLVLFGAFTRLTDSGLGCPDWPGCYGSASPLGARDEIHAAQSAMPTGPVTHGKAWVEMIHRYLASAVGGLILVLAAMAWWQARRREALVSPWWPTLTLVWVCMQGAFGALTVTMKLYPAIVTLHLLGGLGLLMLLAVQREGYRPQPLALPAGLRRGVFLLLGLAVGQAALGGWVSTNYAVLACRDFPTCHGVWWPDMDFERGFTLLRELGRTAGGDYLPFPALTAIHMSHRIGALVVFVGVGLLAWRLWQHGGVARGWAKALLAVAGWQLASGLSNVVLGWPLLAAVAHTGGAAMLLILLTILAVRSLAAQQAGAPARAPAVERLAGLDRLAS